MGRLTSVLWAQLAPSPPNPPQFPVPWGFSFIFLFSLLLFAIGWGVRTIVLLLSENSDGEIYAFLVRSRAFFALGALLGAWALHFLCRVGYAIQIESFLGLFPMGLRSVILGAVGGLGLALTSIINLKVSGIPFLLTPASFDLPSVPSAILQFYLTDYFVTYVLNGALIAPLIEELFFRGLFYSWLRRHANWICALALSSALFGLAHGWSDGLLPSRIVWGLILGWTYEKWGLLSVPYLIHGFANCHLALLRIVVPLFSGQGPA